MFRKMNRTMEAVTMLERCLRLDTSYSPAYLVLAKLRSPPIAARLLYHVTQLIPTSPDYQAYFATWLHERGIPRLALMFYLRALRLQNNHLSATLGVARCLRAQGQIARLHQFLIRWYLMNRRHSSSRRLVHVAELYVHSWDLYKPSQTTAHVYQTHHPECGTDGEVEDSKPDRPRWWRPLGPINHTKSSCRSKQSGGDSTERYMEGDTQPLDPTRICVEQSEQSAQPGS
ncbi:uncharacterized protein LOC128988078 [Macrosteles quadrilineatus]|uniref:uncharacterized protein LOC128988078 n=1 Tax=Macrosteles quadrilineatus TaxID=74068 RepID=UPI0023E228C2|nr:uncharacterized protein LOC128988078 [Macrosteles quadrilineatus]